MSAALFCLGACLLGCECEGAALDFLFAGCLLVSLRLKESKCRLHLFGCLLVCKAGSMRGGGSRFSFCWLLVGESETEREWV